MCGWGDLLPQAPDGSAETTIPNKIKLTRWEKVIRHGPQPLSSVVADTEHHGWDTQPAEIATKWARNMRFSACWQAEEIVSNKEGLSKVRQLLKKRISGYPTVMMAMAPAWKYL